MAGYLDRIRKFRGHENSAPAGYAIAGEATDIRAPKQYYTSEIKYTGTLTSRFLVEAGFAINNESYDLTPQNLDSVPPLEQGGRTPTNALFIPKRDVTLQTAFDSYDGGVYYREPIRKTFVGAASYVTGSHNIKAGIQYGYGYFWRQRRMAADAVQLYRNGAPSQVIIYNTPQSSQSDMNADQGIYVQDSWSIGRFTINPGVRFEHFNGSIAGRSVGAGRFVPERTFADVENVPNWNTVSPRFGIAWDVQGDGKTAVKAGFGKYVRAYGTGFADTYDPNFFTSATLSWADLNGDNIAQGGLAYNADGSRQTPCVYRTAGCEIDFSNLSSTFGTKPQQTFDPDIQRPFQYEMNASVQRELVPGTSVTFSFKRRDYRNLIWSDNTLVNPSDYTKYTIASPLDASKTVDVYNLATSKATAFSAVDSNSDNKRYYNGYDIGFQSRIRGLNIFGGYSAGHTISVTCQTEDPNNLAFCDQSQYDIPMYSQFKLNGSYQLPWKVSVAATIQSYNGDARNGTYDGSIPATSMVDPSLRVTWNMSRADFLAATAKAGYNNGAGVALTQSSVNVQLQEPGQKLLGRQNQADIRLKRTFQLGRLSLEGQADAYNAFNTGVVLQRVQTFGSRLDVPSSILQGRLFRLGLQARW